MILAHALCFYSRFDNRSPLPLFGNEGYRLHKKIIFALFS